MSGHKVRSALHQDLERRLRDAGITIAFPQRDIHIQSGDQPMSKKLGLTQRRDSATKA